MSGAPEWDLSGLVESAEPESVLREMDGLVAKAAAFRDAWQTRLATLDAAGLKEFLMARDELFEDLDGPLSYARLSYSANSTDATARTLNEAASNAGVKIGQALAFSELGLGELLASDPSLVAAPEVAEYRHSLERSLESHPHHLPEREEQLIMSKDRNGIDAWSQLQGDWLSTRTFRMTVDGEQQELPYGRMVSFYQDGDRRVRKEANRSVYEELGRDEILWSSALRSICSDHLEMIDRRRYGSPIEPSLHANDVDAATIDAMMSVMASSDVYRRYLGAKAELMGLGKLGNWDITAPLPGLPEKTYTWDESRQEVVAAYAKFDQQMGEWAEDMFAQRRIDGSVRKGKVSGAFCSYWYGGRTAFVLQSFNGRMGDVYTQMHELGHAVHGYLASRSQKPSNFDMGSCLAECGSIFGELLLTDQLLSKAGTKEERRAVLSHVLDEFGMAAFQVSARYHFETSLYDAIREGVFLDGETIASLWTKARDDVYRDSVEWLPEMKWEWTMKLHYYIPNYRYYNYPYVFAQLFVFALYRLYLEQGRGFVPKLKALLASGSSRAPADLAAELGFDIRQEAFWRKGIDQAEEFLSQLTNTI